MALQILMATRELGRNKIYIHTFKKHTLAFANLIAITLKKNKKPTTTQHQNDFCDFWPSPFQGVDSTATNFLFKCLYSIILDYYPPSYNEFALY